ncbi:MAG TPA: class I SAM-dependent methyltransferase [Vicinamibacterales bacterium]|nr:class I SAM-dependent methyltransferase [Vicinamibacterales bacterium]
MTPGSLAATLRRLEDERAEADSRYNDALTALDRALARVPSLPQPPAEYDDSQLPALNDTWDLPSASGAAGLKGRIARLVWRAVAPAIERQRTFNSRVVDHLNRNVAAHREAQAALRDLLSVLRDQFAALGTLQTHLIQFAQQITPYVDTKDRRVGAQASVVNAAVNEVSGDAAKRWESLSIAGARVQQRLGEEQQAREAADAELRTIAAAAQQAALTVKREMERRSTNAHAGSAPATSPHSAPVSDLDAYKYLGFEDQFRGSQDDIRQRLTSYLPYFEGTSDVLDVGCGRGEFLDLLEAHAIAARGLDLNQEMVELCRARGLEVVQGDVVTYLESLADGALGGLFAAQVVEHLEPGYLLRFLELAHHKLRPGSPMVLETLNPACWVAFFESFIRDITHVWPLHPETLRYLVLASGFSEARIEYRSPVPEADKLQTVAAVPSSPLADALDVINGNVEKLNGRLFTYLDYAIVARRS